MLYLKKQGKEQNKPKYRRGRETRPRASSIKKRQKLERAIDLLEYYSLKQRMHLIEKQNKPLARLPKRKRLDS